MLPGRLSVTKIFQTMETEKFSLRGIGQKLTRAQMRQVTGGVNCTKVTQYQVGGCPVGGYFCTYVDSGGHSHSFCQGPPVEP